MAKTSLTETKLRALLKDADSKTLFCQHIHGFYAIKQKTGISYRLRYLDNLGKRRTYTIGKFPALKPAIAGDKALEFVANKRDPLKEKESERKNAVNELNQANTRNLGKFIDNVFYPKIRQQVSADERISMLRRNFGHLFDKDMSELCANDVIEWQSGLDEKTSYATIEKAYSTLKSVLNQAVKSKSIDTNPLPKKNEDVLVRPADNRDARHSKRRPLTDDEINKLFYGLNAFNQQRKEERQRSIKHGRDYLESYENVTYSHFFVPFALCAYYLGMRTGDIRFLDWSEIDFNFQNQISFQPRKTRHHGDPIRVNLPMNESIRTTLLEWHKQCGKPSTGLVFPSPVTGRELDKMAHKKPWLKVKELGGLPEELNFYSLRHNWVSQLIASGVPLFKVARMAGHKSTKMIESNYGHLTPTTDNPLDAIKNPTDSDKWRLSV